MLLTRSAPRVAQTTEGLADHPMEVADMAKDTSIQRFWAKTARSSVGCWDWSGSIHRTGYGVLTVGRSGFDRRQVVAHRFAYELLVGPVPAGMHLDHLCRNRACVNPEHLEPVTPGENVLRGIGRAAENSRKTQCDHGHPFDEANTRYNKNGDRSCRTCDRDRHRLVRR